MDKNPFSLPQASDHIGHHRLEHRGRVGGIVDDAVRADVRHADALYGVLLRRVRVRPFARALVDDCRETLILEALPHVVAIGTAVHRLAAAGQGVADGPLEVWNAANVNGGSGADGTGAREGFRSGGTFPGHLLLAHRDEAGDQTGEEHDESEKMGRFHRPLSCIAAIIRRSANT